MVAIDNSLFIDEIKVIRKYKYKQLCQYLNNKYGAVTGPYFINENCKTINQKIKRTTEGLFIHHVCENKAIMLSHPEYAIQFPFEWQEGKNLVYCNYLEHMLLHMAIVKEYLKTQALTTKMAVGIGGLFNFIIPEIIDYINGYEYSRDYMKKALSVIDGNELLFIDLLEELKESIIHDSDILHITCKSLNIKGVRFLDRFKKGKMTDGGRFNECLFEYEIYKKYIKYVDSKFIISVFEDTNKMPGYDYKINVNPLGKYSEFRMSYWNKSGGVTFRRYAFLNDDQFDINALKEKYYKKINIYKDKYMYIKRTSKISFKENKQSKNKNKRYSLTIDGMVVNHWNYSKDQAETLVKQYS